MDAQPRSQPGEAGARPPSPEHERQRPRAVVIPNVLIPRQISSPMDARNQVTQVAMLSFNNGIFHIARTGMLVIDPEVVASRDPSLPVPVAIPTMNLPLPVFENPVETCRIFLMKLRCATYDRPPRLGRAVELMIQLLVDNVLTPKQFCERLERLLCVRPQPHLVQFLQANMQHLRRSLYLNHMTLEGIERPERSAVFPMPIPTPELPEYGPVVDPPGPILPIAAIEPRQVLPLSTIPYDLPLPMSELHVSHVQKSGLPSLIRTELQEGDLHLYNPHVGYVHFRVTPTCDSFQVGNTTVRLLSPRPSLQRNPPLPPNCTLSNNSVQQ